MNVLLIGSGAREHSMAWKFSKSRLLSQLYLWPGNCVAGRLAEVLPPAANYADLLSVTRKLALNLVVVGPEVPLAEGIADFFLSQGIPVFGPTKAGAQLEASKRFAKDLMAEAGIPTATYSVTIDEQGCRREALMRLRKDGGVVLKASGLASGKGVFVCASESDIENALKTLYSKLKDAASEVVVEEFLRGRESSYFSYLGSGTRQFIGFAVDYKRLRNADQGPNTGGMGCYTPVPWLPREAEALVRAKIEDPLLKALERRGISYTGCLYVGLMWTAEGPKVVEFNCRLGDPEAQVLAVSDDADWLEMMALAAGCSKPMNMGTKRIQQTPAVAIVMTSAQYPFGNSRPGEGAILDPAIFESNSDNLAVFAGAVREADDGWIRVGDGRVLTIVAQGPSLAKARTVAYGKVNDFARLWPDAHWRTDIAELPT